MIPCEVCAIPLGYRETCPSPACPCFGTRAGSAEMELAAMAWRSRPSRAASRAMTGTAALDTLDRFTWLAMAEARGRVIDVEIGHQAAP